MNRRPIITGMGLALLGVVLTGLVLLGLDPERSQRPLKQIAHTSPAWRYVLRLLRE